MLYLEVPSNHEQLECLNRLVVLNFGESGEETVILASGLSGLGISVEYELLGCLYDCLYRVR